MRTQRYRPEAIHPDLGEAFFDRVRPADFPRTILRYRNERWARAVGLDGLDDETWIRHFGRFDPLAGTLPQPLALRYHGHQFRSYNPDLGDGRGFLFAQLRDGEGRLLDLGTKGSGKTPWSRAGDGRLTLKGGVREVLATAMLEALRVDTSKSFSLVETGEQLYRGDEPSPTRSAVLVRLSHSHIRIGTFQRFAALGDGVNLARLVSHCVRHYIPEAARADPVEQTVAFLEAVVARVCRTCAQWMAAGFVHGVLNTDNINITGESFDYGPYRFLPVYEPGFTAAYFDETGLYAYGRQPDAVGWNLARLTESLLALAPIEALQPALDTFGTVFWEAMRKAMTARLGLTPGTPEADDRLIRALFTFLRESKAPFEQAMFDFHGGPARLERLPQSPAAGFYAGPEFEALREALAGRRPARKPHAYFERREPVTLRYDEIEALWKPIDEMDDWSGFHAKLGEIELVRTGYSNQ